MNKFDLAWRIALLVLISLGTYVHLYHPNPVPLTIDLNELPPMIGEWKLVGSENQKDIIRILGADKEVINFYKDSSGNQINLYIGYFETQKQNKEIIYYKNQWLHNNTEKVDIALHPHGTIQVNRTIFKDSARNRLILFWYDLNGKIIVDRYLAKLTTAIDGCIRGRTNGSIIIVSMNLENIHNYKNVLRAETEFIQELYPILRDFLPY